MVVTSVEQLTTQGVTPTWENASAKPHINLKAENVRQKV